MDCFRGIVLVLVDTWVAVGIAEERYVESGVALGNCDFAFQLASGVASTESDSAVTMTLALVAD